jgi:hypothetical protein
MKKSRHQRSAAVERREAKANKVIAFVVITNFIVVLSVLAEQLHNIQC